MKPTKTGKMGNTKKLDKGSIAPKKTFTTPQLIEALYDVENLMARTACQFFLLDETARQCFMQQQTLDPVLDLSEITVGVVEQQFAESCKKMLKTIRPDAEWTNANITYVFKDIPITIWRIHKPFEVLQRPDKIYFYTEDFFIPNPFRAYWNMRDLIE